jgi:hypothetical protein
MQENLKILKISLKKKIYLPRLGYMRSFLKFRTLFFIISLAAFNFSLTTKASEYRSPSFVSGNEIKIKVLASSLKPDLSKKSAEIKIILKETALIDKSSKFSSFSIEAYEYISGEKVSVSKVSSAILNPKKYSPISIPLNHFSSSSREIFLDIFSPNGVLISTYKVIVEAENLDAQITSDEKLLADSNCDGSVFGKCQLEYILDNIKFEVSPEKRPATRVLKEESGAFKVQLATPFKNARVSKNKINLLDQSITNISEGETVSLVEDLILNPKVLKATPENGSIEFDGDKLFYTSNGSRKQLAHTGQLGGSNLTVDSVSNLMEAASINNITLKKQNSEPYSCNSSKEGSIAATSYYRTCICNGSKWVYTSDGKTACDWGIDEAVYDTEIYSFIKTTDIHAYAKFMRGEMVELDGYLYTVSTNSTNTPLLRYHLSESDFTNPASFDYYDINNFEARDYGFEEGIIKNGTNLYFPTGQNNDAFSYLVKLDLSDPNNFNDTNKYSLFEISSKEPNFTHPRSGTFYNDLLFLIDGGSGHLIKYDSNADLSDPSSYEVFDLSTIITPILSRTTADLFVHGGYLYILPDRTNPYIFRYDLSEDFSLAGSYEFVDLSDTNLHPAGATTGYTFAGTFGNYIYYAPWLGINNSHGLFLRYDTTKSFNNLLDNGYEYFDLAEIVSDDTFRARNSCTDNFGNIYMLEYVENPSNNRGRIIVFDPNGTFNSSDSYSVIDIGPYGEEFMNFYTGCKVIGDYLYAGLYGSYLARIKVH